MRIEAIPIGNNPQEDVNVIIEVPVGGQPIKYELEKEAGVFVSTGFCTRRRLIPEITVSSRIPYRRMVTRSMCWSAIPVSSFPAA